MAKDFNTLIRDHQWIVDEKRRALGQLLGKANSLESDAANLEIEIVDEQGVAKGHSEELGFIYGAYAEAAIGRREGLVEQRAEVEEKITLAQAEMRDEFRELKVYEISQEAEYKRAEEELNKLEQAFLDEVGQRSKSRLS